MVILRFSSIRAMEIVIIMPKMELERRRIAASRYSFEEETPHPASNAAKKRRRVRPRDFADEIAVERAANGAEGEERKQITNLIYREEREIAKTACEIGDEGNCKEKKQQCGAAAHLLGVEQDRVGDEHTDKRHLQEPAKADWC